MRKQFVTASILVLLTISLLGTYVNPIWWWCFLWVGPIVLLGIRDMIQQKHALLRNFPIVGHGRYIADWLRPKIYQYFVEPDTDGRPFTRLDRSVIYQRGKGQIDTQAFGTQLNIYENGYEWINHSIAALDHHDLPSNPRIIIGGKKCKQPYSASLLNVSAMSYGSLSANAIKALNGGAAIGGFAHNTGEGGISDHHNHFGGDLIYQIGTGYFGSRDSNGNFSEEAFKKRASADNVKMIEIKLSQGAKPGHGGILPAKKVSEEIARIRGVEVGKSVLSPPYHKAFDTPKGLLHFIEKCRILSGGKPVGFKLCVGQKSEFIAICKAMIETGILPDFIAVDGGEGGTGAAPPEFSNSVGTPYREGLVFVYDTLVGFNLKKEIKLIAAGKIVHGYHIFQSIALGADLCYSARAMMMALGCIQALECNHNTCPTGVATNNPQLMKGLVVGDKKARVAQYHQETVQSFVELMAATGISKPSEINRSHINKRVGDYHSARFDELFPYLTEACLLHEATVPEHYKRLMAVADSNSFHQRFVPVYIERD